MGDYLYDFNDLGMDGALNGIPIPRSHHFQQYTRSEIPLLNNQLDNDYGSPLRTPMVPPNSLASSFGPYNSNSWMSQEVQRNTLSPYNCSSPLMSSNASDNDVDIKMEPTDLDILEIGRVMNSVGQAEDNLLDDVNFADLIMTDEMESSTTCLDPKYSSPAAMTTVRPDEILDLGRVDPGIPPLHSLTPSISVPGRSEPSTLSGLAASTFPPQGIAWKDDPFLTVVHPGSFVNPQPQEQPHPPSMKEFLLSQPRFSSNNVQQSLNHDIKTEPMFSELDSSPTALQDLLINPSAHPNDVTMQTQGHAAPKKSIPPQLIPIGQSVPGPPSFLTNNTSFMSSRLSSSAPVNDFSLDQIWQRRDPKPHLLSTGSLAEEIGGSTSSLSTGTGILSPTNQDLSIDENDTDEDSDVEHYDSDSDNDSIRSEDTSSGQSTRRERHFWQYNVQAKGPKGHRVNITKPDTNPHQLEEIMDPVFSPACSIQGIKHSGKARRGDGNDLTPSPRKLVCIGTELEVLNKKINDMAPASDLPSYIRSKSRKEKNKLASRACRLKKKAQHEANKIKLYGLEQEHKAMLALIAKSRADLYSKIELSTTIQDFSSGSPTPEQFLAADSPLQQYDDAAPSSLAQKQMILTSLIDRASKMRTKQRIAGHTTDFVNKVIENCRSGNRTAGLDELSHTFVKTSTTESNPDHGLYT